MPTYQLHELLAIGEYVEKYYEQLPRSELLLDESAQYVLDNYNEELDITSLEQSFVEF
jgi:hypothetical protein